MSAYYRHVIKAEKTGEREITFTFDGPGNRELPQIVGQLTVLPKHWWEGTDKSGNKRDVAATTLEPPLGCGAYRIKEFVPGRTIVYERVEDYWGKDLNVNVGRDNFDELRYEYFRDTTVAIEAFKADADRLAHREQRQELGDRLRFPGGQGQARAPGGISDPQLRRHAGLRLQHPPRRNSGSARAPRLQLRVRFRGDEQADVLRPVQARRTAISKDSSLRRADLPTGRGAGDPGNGARQGAAGGVHHALHQSGRRQRRGGARQSARGGAAVARSRLRGAGPASWSTPRPANR